MAASTAAEVAASLPPLTESQVQQIATLLTVSIDKGADQ